MKSHADNFFAVLVGAGKGKRAGFLDKAFLEIEGKPAFFFSLEKFLKLKEIKRVVLVLKKEKIKDTELLLKKHFEKDLKKILIVEGGTKRAESSRNGVLSLKKDKGWVFIHDIARPFFTIELLKRLIKESRNRDAIIPVVEVKDTLKNVLENGFVKKTLKREEIFASQTPQLFRLDILKSAYKNEDFTKKNITDEAMIFEKLNKKIYTIKGEEENIKITTQSDIKKIELMNQNLSHFDHLRAGFGIDTHRFSKNRKLILGGVNIKYDFGLSGYSDADCLIHAIIDALLGASASGDLGMHFPSTDKSLEGISSVILLKKVLNMLDKLKFKIINIDATILAEVPRLSPYQNKIKENLSKIMKIEKDRINIKVTSNDGLGYIGEKKGITAFASVQLLKL